MSASQVSPPIQTMPHNLMRGHVEEAYSKGKILAESDCIISEFGTRRRRSYRTQDLVVDELIKAYKSTPSSRGRLAGTSNVYQRRFHPLNTSPNPSAGSLGTTIQDRPRRNDRPVCGFLIQTHHDPNKHLSANGSWGLPLLEGMRMRTGGRWTFGRQYIRATSSWR